MRVQKCILFQKSGENIFKECRWVQEDFCRRKRKNSQFKLVKILSKKYLSFAYQKQSVKTVGWLYEELIFRTEKRDLER